MTEIVKASIRMDTSKIEPHPPSPAENTPAKQTKEVVGRHVTREKAKPLAGKTANRNPGTSKKKLKSKKSDFIVRRRSLMIPIKMTAPHPEIHHQDASTKGKVPPEKAADRNAPQTTATIPSKEMEHRKAVEGVKTTHIEQQVQIPKPREHFAEKQALTVKNGVVQRVATQSPDPLDELVLLLENHHLSQRMMTLLRFFAASMETARKRHLSHRKQLSENQLQVLKQQLVEPANSTKEEATFLARQNLPQTSPTVLKEKFYPFPKQVQFAFPAKKTSTSHVNEDESQTKATLSGKKQKPGKVLKQQLARQAAPTNSKEETSPPEKQGRSQINPVALREKSLPLAKQDQLPSPVKKLSTSHVKNDDSQMKTKFNGKMQQATAILRQHLARQANSSPMKKEAIPRHESPVEPKRFAQLQRQTQSVELTTVTATTEKQKILPKKQTPPGKRSTPRKALRAPSTATPSHSHLARRSVLFILPCGLLGR
ncbi:hypothetical protein ANCDUO_18070 [Ancylostoma duodenale]|uniref:Uncharacterized protein n=1 Tax=Ancylostoma duodenale TaxID=51022 RepID=A0A0C2CPX7_9BILA|nr:hypothetical protein ANCDUO_18070 [Ancylostoma duodenale]